jgi:ketosteroid isomerase-like protein
VSEREIEAARRAYAGFNAADADAMCEAVDPEIRFFPMLAAVEGGYRGHAGIRSWLAEMDDSFSDFGAEIHKFEYVDGFVVAQATFNGCGRTSGATVTRPLAHALSVEGDRVTWWRAYYSRDEVVAAIEAGEAGPQPPG